MKICIFMNIKAKMMILRNSSERSMGYKRMNMTKDEMRRIAEDDINERISDLITTYRETPVYFEEDKGKLIGAVIAYGNVLVLSVSETLFVLDALDEIVKSLNAER